MLLPYCSLLENKQTNKQNNNFLLPESTCFASLDFQPFFLPLSSCNSLHHHWTIQFNAVLFSAGQLSRWKLKDLGSFVLRMLPLLLHSWMPIESRSLFAVSGKLLSFLFHFLFRMWWRPKMLCQLFTSLKQFVFPIWGFTFSFRKFHFWFFQKIPWSYLTQDPTLN